MKKILALAFLAAVVAGCATRAENLPTQAGVDLKRYAGTWYEQARLPNNFQDDCAGNVQAHYVLQADDTLHVTNQCRTADGDSKMAEGEGRLSHDANPRDPSKLEIRFAPGWTSWLPMVWGDYWILKLDADYRYSLVGTPDREYLWVLTRDQAADENKVRELLDYAATQGFDVSRVMRTAQQ